MSETNLNERELRKKRIEKICQIFENDITDENIRQFIFGGKEGYSRDAVMRTDNYVLYMRNVLVLCFYFSYACYKCDMDSDSCDSENLVKHNSKRIINSLKNSFVRYPVTQELIQFVLTDIQFELAQGDFSELLGVFGNLSRYSMAEFAFNPYFKLIAEYNKNPSRFQFSRLELLRMFTELLEKMTFLSEYNLKSYGLDNFVFESKNTDSDSKYAEMPITHLLFCDNEHYSGGIYHLASIEYNDSIDENQTMLNLKYFNCSEDLTLVFSVPDSDAESHLYGQRINEIISEIISQEWTPDSNDAAYKKNKNSIDQIHTINYKYIKNMALAISDAISSNEGSKKLIFDRFCFQYPYIFEKTVIQNNVMKNVLASYDDESINWDTVVVMLLIEVSPTVVLEYIIRKVPETFYHIVKNLYKRIFDVENLSAFNGSRSQLKNAVKNVIDEKLIVGESAGFGRIPTARVYDKLFPRAAAMFIISKLSSLQENEVDENLVYTGNLKNNISLLQNFKNDSNIEKAIRNSCIILGETIKHITCFYAGLFAYGKEKAVYDKDASDRCLTKSEILHSQKNMENIFMDAARKEAESLKKCVSVTPSETIEMLDKFIVFCGQCNPVNKKVTDKSKCLYAAIGKHEISNSRVLLNLKKSLMAASKDAYNYDSELWLETVLEILEYLKTGSKSSTPLDENLFNAVYPFTAAFNRGKENTDGYRTVNFSLNIDIDEDNVSDFLTDVNVLSEFFYNRSEVYYCLPNVLRSNYKWWIDPVLISFRDFNAIFDDSREEVN